MLLSCRHFSVTTFSNVDNLAGRLFQMSTIQHVVFFKCRLFQMSTFQSRHFRADNFNVDILKLPRESSGVTTRQGHYHATRNVFLVVPFMSNCLLCKKTIIETYLREVLLTGACVIKQIIPYLQKMTVALRRNDPSTELFLWTKYLCSPQFIF